VVDERAETRFYRAEGLIELARQANLKATRRLIVDWVELGLLDQPIRRGLGRGNGSMAVWNETQMGLFIDLLALRNRPTDPVKHVAGLANLPVSGWLWGYPGVPIRQVRRALGTWCGRHRSRESAPVRATRQVAQQIAGQLDHPHATNADRKALRELLEKTMRERRFDPAEMRAAVERVFDPNGVGVSRGPEVAAVTLDSAVLLLHAHALGYLELDSFHDEEFEAARVIYRQTRREYVSAWPQLNHDRQGSPLPFEEPTFENTLNGACRELILLLGMGRLMPQRQAKLATEAIVSESQLELIDV
jgi:hypothetical protein